MKIGIMGMGKVGDAVAFGLQRLGHEIVGYDKDPGRSTHLFMDLHTTDLVFICVPTPMRYDGPCELSYVQTAVEALADTGYNGLAVIKSTVPPGTTDQFAHTYPKLRLAFCPEFLRERARFSDFYENHEVCIAGIGGETLWVDAALIKSAHGNIPKHFVAMTRIEAELAKYFVNCFNAYRINFANSFYDVCKALGADYSKIKHTVTQRVDTKSSYLDANEQFRAFGGACLPKDTRAFAEFVRDLGMKTELFSEIVNENERIKAGVTS